MGQDGGGLASFFVIVVGIFVVFFFGSAFFFFFNLVLLPHNYYIQHSKIAPRDEAFLDLGTLLSFLAQADLFVLQ